MSPNETRARTWLQDMDALDVPGWRSFLAPGGKTFNVHTYAGDPETCQYMLIAVFSDDVTGAFVLDRLEGDAKAVTEDCIDSLADVEPAQRL